MLDITTRPPVNGIDLQGLDETIAKIPGLGKSVTLSTMNRGAGRLGGGFGDVRFDVTITARTEAGEAVQQDVFLDING